MVNSCAAYGCKNRSTSKFPDGRKITFHRLPLSNPARLQQWVKNIQRKNLPQKHFTLICSDHFTASCFLDTSITDGRRVLRSDSVPTLFASLPKSSAYEPTPDRRRPNAAMRKRDVKSAGRTTKQRGPTVESAEEQLRRNEANAIVNQLISDVHQSVSPMPVQDQTEEMIQLISENKALKEYIEELERRLFCFENVKGDSQLVRFYTGLPDYEAFEALQNFLGPAQHDLINPGCIDKTPHSAARPGREKKLSTENQLFLFLCRLRVGMLENDLALRFGVSQSLVSRTVTTWASFMFARFKAPEFQLWPPASLVLKHLPECFRILYPTTTLILDCTEITCDKPQNPVGQGLTWSNYKNSNTLKILIGITPAGAVCFVSTPFGGNTSDREMVRLSGILDKLEPGTAVMADRGFTVEDLLIERGVQLNIPPFLHGRPQFSEREVTETRRIASLRIHVERAIGRVKHFRILDHFPITSIPVCEELVYCCCMLTNFLPLLTD